MSKSKIYWVDRFDHILTEKEYSEQSIISFVDVKSMQDQIFEKYLLIENSLKAFLIELTLSIEPEINKIKIQASPKGNLEFYIKQNLRESQLNLLEKLRQHNQTGFESRITNLEELDFYLELALREKIDLKVKGQETSYSIGYDLKIFVENVNMNLLKGLTHKHELYILSEEVIL